MLSYVDRETEARSLLNEILQVDPNNVQAHETMGYLEFRAGHRDEARKWYGEAVKLDSKDYLAYYFFAEFSMDQPPGPDDKAIEDSLRRAIQLNPEFAPSYDRLAVFYLRGHENLDEAHMLSLQAIQLDPSEVAFRINSANVLMAMQRYDDAVTVLRGAEKIAKNPSQAELVQTQIDQIEQYNRARAETQAHANVQNSAQAEQSKHEQVFVPVAVNANPKHPTMPKTGPKHSAVGVIREATCIYPSELDFKLNTADGKTLLLYTNEMPSIDLTAAGFTPSGPVNPCVDFEGWKAAVQYVDTSDSSVSGQVVGIELRK